MSVLIYPESFKTIECVYLNVGMGYEMLFKCVSLPGCQSWQEFFFENFKKVLIKNIFVLQKVLLRRKEGERMMST